MVKPFWEKRAKGTVTTPLGFYASGLHGGIKRSRRKYDISLIYSKDPCVGAGVFTTNTVKAWCVQYSSRVMRGGKARAILASSGNANCMNGKSGRIAVEDCARYTASALGICPEEVLVAQTGLIGVEYPTDKVKNAMPRLVKKLTTRETGGRGAARGILTTDKVVKQVALSFDLHGKQVTIGAIAKGAGMVHPNMATMLGFVTTDCAISRPLLKRALRHAVDDTFNKIAVDNDMSTNDMVFVLANGRAGNRPLQKVDRDYRMFRDALEEVCRVLAFEIVKDGEGVAHVCTLRLKGARSPSEAERVARHIGNSMLFKTMLAGSDPNWGRIAAAIGASGFSFKPEALSIAFGDAVVVSHGKIKTANLGRARKVLERKAYTIDVVIGKGRGKAEFVTSDLTTKYVMINSAYS